MKQNGFTLVEILVVMAIISILSFMSVSFSSSWADSNRVIDGENLLSRAFNFAKAAAIRNPNDIVSDNPAAVVCFQKNELSVRGPENDATTVDCGSKTIVWRNATHSLINIKAENNSFTCACFNNRGRLTTTNCTTCSNTTNYLVVSGRENVSYTLK